MLLIRGEILNIRTSEFTNQQTQETKTSHYLQLLTNRPSSGSGLGEEVKLAPKADVELFRNKIGSGVQLAVRPFVAANGKLYLSSLADQPPGATGFFEIDGEGALQPLG